MSSVLLEIGELLRQFAHSPWRDLYLRTADYTVFVAKPGGGSNPLLNAARADAQQSAEPAYTLRAPHVGTVGATAQPGQHLRAGDVALTLLVLDQAVEVVADRAGVVAAVLALPGTQVQHDTPLLRF